MRDFFATWTLATRFFCLLCSKCLLHPASCLGSLFAPISFSCVDVAHQKRRRAKQTVIWFPFRERCVFSVKCFLIVLHTKRILRRNVWSATDQMWNEFNYLEKMRIWEILGVNQAISIHPSIVWATLALVTKTMTSTALLQNSSQDIQFNT